MPGTPLDITYPEANDPVKTCIAELITAVQTIQADVEAKIVPSEMSITSALDMRHYPLQNVGAIVLDSAVSTSLAAGNVVYYQGNWYLVGSLGAVQITDGDHIAEIAFGGIAGNYGGDNPARVTYEGSSHKYIFTYDTGSYAQLIAGSLNLPAADGGDVTVLADSTQTTSTNLVLPAPAASGISSLAIDNNGKMLKDAAVTHDQTISAGLTVNSLTASTGTISGDLSVAGDVNFPTGTTTIGTLTADSFVRTGAMHTTQNLASLVNDIGTAVWGPGGIVFTALDGVSHNAEVLIPLAGMENGRRVTNIVIRHHKTNTTATAMEVELWTDGSLTSIGTASDTTSGTHTTTIVIGSPVTVGATVTFVLAYAAVNTGDKIYNVEVVTDHA